MKMMSVLAILTYSIISFADIHMSCIGATVDGNQSRISVLADQNKGQIHMKTDADSWTMGITNYTHTSQPFAYIFYTDQTFMENYIIIGFLAENKIENSQIFEGRIFYFDTQKNATIGFDQNVTYQCLLN